KQLFSVSGIVVIVVILGGIVGAVVSAIPHHSFQGYDELYHFEIVHENASPYDKTAAVLYEAVNALAAYSVDHDEYPSCEDNCSKYLTVINHANANLVREYDIRVDVPKKGHYV